MVFAPIQEMLVQPQSLGEVFISARGLTGPTAYVNTGTFSTSGQVLSAPLFALLSIKFALCEALDSTGTYIVRVVQTLRGTTPSFTAHWYVLSTGAEVANNTNLSTSTARFVAVGN